MDIISYLNENHAHLFYLMAGISFVIELTILGLSGPLLFFALASVLTGILIRLNILSGWESECFTVGLLSGIIAWVLWKPMKRFQNSGGGADTSSDMIGKKVPSSNEITHEKGSIRFSGIDWSARLSSDCHETSLAANSSCIITGVNGNIMLVKPAP
ncbi:NfeD family protein [Cognaticolwellia mytili]|uniref:NfeD family protein n=1 Tax=Cognaticolwellia mytili TaxID=1888913 RepID=UPI000A175570|nr:NfeD family protein [Cognaticolwellia mytili]